MLFKGALLASAAAVSLAQSSNSTSLCDKYTAALTGTNNATNQLTVLTLLVNTAVIGNYSSLANSSIRVPGILNPNGTYNGQPVNLVGYFDGTLNSTNAGGSTGVRKNFLDGGGATPLTQNKPANDQTSNQYFLLTHLYEFFGLLLGCSEVGMSGYPAYGGSASMYEVHKFMDLNQTQMNYFIEQVALAGASFGVSASDLTTIGGALNQAFNYKCLPAMTIVPSAGNVTQSICIASSCPQASNANCSAYDSQVLMPVAGGGSSVSGSGMTQTGTGRSGGAAGGASNTASGSAASGTTAPRSSANTLVASVAAGVVGIVGAALVAF